MKILFITAEGFDTPNPNNQMTEVLLNFLLDRNYSIHLVQSYRSGVNDNVPKSILKRDNFSHSSIKRIKIDKKSFIKRYISDFIFQLKTIKYWINLKNIDIVYVQSNPTACYLLFILSLIKNWKIVYSIFDIFPGHAYKIGVIQNQLLFNSLEFIQKLSYLIPSIITVLSNDMKNSLIRLGVKENKIKVIPAWIDNEIVKEISKTENKFISKYNIDSNKFYVQFAGSLGYVLDYMTILNVAKILSNEENIEFQIIGDGAVKDNIINYVKENNLRNISFYPLQPIDLVPDVYSAADICLIPLKEGVIYNGTPSKLPILLSCKRIVIISVEKSEFSDQVNKAKIGLTYTIGDYVGIAEKILDIKNNPNKYNYLKENGYNHFLKNLNKDLILSNIDTLFNKII